MESRYDRTRGLIKNQRALSLSLFPVAKKKKEVVCVLREMVAVYKRSKRGGLKVKPTSLAPWII